jgi:alpha-galactosidase/6-phospho-beta-glucosidase family protein
MARAQGARCEIHLTTLLEEAIAGTQYVSTQLRVGGWKPARALFWSTAPPPSL